MTKPPRRTQAAKAAALRFLTETHTTHTPRAQAEALGLSYSYVLTLRRELYAAGTLAMAQRATRRPMTDDELQRVTALLAGGMTIAQAAEVVNRTRSALAFALNAAGVDVAALQAQARVYSVRQVAQLFAVDEYTVGRWIDGGSLDAGRLGDRPAGASARRKTRAGHVCGDRRRYQVTYTALADFVRVRAAWMTYDPAHIADAGLRRLAETQRQARPGRWWTWRAVVQAQHYSRRAACDWPARGWPGPEWEQARWGLTRYLWVPDGAALPGPPAERSRWANRRRAA